MPRFVAIAAAALAVGLFVFTDDSHSASVACRAKVFNTQLVKTACVQGGQLAAKDAMKQFTKNHARQQPGLNCNSCHTILAPDYPLRADGLTTFRRLGGS